MDPCRRLVAGAVILNCILAGSAAVLKVPGVVETETLQEKFSGRSDGIHEFEGVQSTGGSATGSFKRSVVDSGIANVAYSGNFATTKGNPHVAPDASVINQSKESVTPYVPTEQLGEKNNVTGNIDHVIPTLESSRSVVSPEGDGQIVSVSNKFSSEAGEQTRATLLHVNVNRGLPELLKNGSAILPVESRQIVVVGSKFFPEKAADRANLTEQAPSISIDQPMYGRADQVFENVRTTMDVTASSDAVIDLEVMTTEKQRVELTDESLLQERRGAMNLTFYENVLSDRNASDIPHVSNMSRSLEVNTSTVSGTVVLGDAANSESNKSEEMYAATERRDDTGIPVPTTDLPENLGSIDSEAGPRADIDSAVPETEPAVIEPMGGTTETESFVEMTTVWPETPETHHSGTKETSGRQLDGTFYNTDAELLSEKDNEIGGDHADADVNIDSSDCSRPCELGAPPRVCKFTFHVEWYHTMSKACFGCPGNASDCDRPHCVPADGNERPVIVVNRMMPGPTVSVCLHDTVQVDVVNEMTEETTSVHWHGQHQRGSPHMDGVPFVTQCPIGPASAFRYRFVTETPGTHFWHSHTGCQRADGLYGALIVRTPRAVDPQAHLYDEEGPVLQLADWGRPLGVDKFVNHHHASGDNKPTAILVNGRGGLHWATGQAGPPPVHFTVKQGKRYRFRVINNGFLNCPIQLSVDGHSLLVISSDGADIDPVRVESLVTYAGERWDLVLEATAAVSSYWVRLRGLMDCGAEFTKAHQVAVLRYQGADLAMPAGNVSWEDADRPGLSLNALNVGPGTQDALVVSELTAVPSKLSDPSLVQKPDRTFYLGYDFYAIDNPHFHNPKFYGMDRVKQQDRRLFTPQFNHLSLRLPSFPLLSQFRDLDESTICNESTMAGQGCETGYCECLHMLSVPLGAVVEIVLVDAGNMYNANHPFHLHGHAFRVVAMGKLGTNTSVEEVRALDRAGGIRRKLHGAPIKDTVTVPDGGFTVLRVSADNPGYWLFHCHIEFHVEVGMAVVFKVGEHSDFPPPPPGFPRCNSWLPPYPSKGQTRARLTAADPDALQDKRQRSSAIAVAPAMAYSLLLGSFILVSSAALR